MSILKIIPLLLIIILGGCVRHGAAFIETLPSGAEVVDLSDDTIIGVTPVKVWWRDGSGKRKFVNVRFQKNGYRDKTSSFWVTLRHADKASALDNPQHVEITLDKN